MYISGDAVNAIKLYNDNMYKHYYDYYYHTGYRHSLKLVILYVHVF